MPSVFPEVVAPQPELSESDGPLFPATRDAIIFLRRQWKWVLASSAVLLIPCFWHRQIQATDLGSHVYNAWLVQLIRAGQAPGLTIVPQGSNVLFDLMLSGLFRAFGPAAAEPIAVSLAVLTLFWGGFALASSAAGLPAWKVTPLLAMACYGFVFNMGFFNLYLSVGFSLFALAILWRGERWDYAWLGPLTVLIWMSHLLGTVALLGIGGFLLLLRYLPMRWQLVTSACAIGGYFIARWYVLKHFVILKQATDIYWMMGVDQFVVYRKSFAWGAAGLMLVAAISIALRLRRGGREHWRKSSAWIQIYAVVALAVACAPGGILHPKLQYMGYVPDRASLYSAILLCCLLAVMRLEKWQVAAFSGITIVFFGFLYADTLLLDRQTTKLEQAVAQLKPDTRVTSTFFLKSDWRIYEQHITDRACVGRCFYVGNYEPSSGQFRIKAVPSNRIVTADSRVVTAMSRGVYPVTEADLPLVEAYGCGPNLQDACLRELQAGEYNGRAAFDQLAAFQESQRRKANQ